MNARERGVSTLLLVVIVAAVMLVLGGAFIAFWHRSSTPQASATAPPSLTPEQKAYFSSLEITDARMSAAENFLGDTVTMLDARILNKGDKVVRRLDLELTFVDTLQQVILREAARPITARTPPLRPGESRAVHLTFERIPPDWDQAVPFIRPTYVGF